MILSAQQIEAAHLAGEIVIDPFEQKQIQAASYDMRVGPQGATTKTKELVNVEEAGYLLLEPGDFAFVSVLEELTLGNQYAARFGLRSMYSRKGLIATAGHIDPGFHGRLIVGLTNLTPTPVSLPFKDDFISVEFYKLEQPTTKPYKGPYQDRLALGPEEIKAVTEGTGMALSEVLTTLGTLSQNVSSLAQSVSSLKGELSSLRWVLPLIVTVIVTVGVAIMGVIVAIK